MYFIYNLSPEVTGISYMPQIYVVLWWVDPGWMPGIHQSHSVTPLLSWTEERNIMKGLWVEIRTGINHPPITVTCKTDLTQEN